MTPDPGGHGSHRRSTSGTPSTQWRASSRGQLPRLLLLAFLLVPACVGSARPQPAAAASAEAGTALPIGWAEEPGALRPATRARVIEEAGVALARLPRPVTTLASAGSTDKDDPKVVASREAHEDADDAVILALAWRATGEARYRDATVGRLVAWARTNRPTGHPIDETRLDGLVQAYVLVRPTLLPAEDETIRAWLRAMRDAKRAWQFGPTTTVNNHRTHHLKMLVLLDRALDDDLGLVGDRDAAEAHAAANLDAETGESVDLKERDALYYHAYNLDAWLELRLATGCCDKPVTAAYQLLEKRLLAGDTSGEFEGSTAPIDAARGQAGYGYGAAGSTFDPERAEHAVLTFHTGAAAPESPLLKGISAANVQRRNLYTFARYQSWTH